MLAEASTSPETTARIVANAAAENSASAMSPPAEPSPPPRNCASSGAARLPPLPTASVAPSPTSSARAPKPMIVTSSVKTPMKPIVHTTDWRAALPSGTVKNRIRMCGRPAVPKKIVRPVEITSAGVVRNRPGPRNFAPSPDSVAALSSSWDGLKLNFASTQTEITTPAIISIAALTIWIHVVASMPPKTM